MITENVVHECSCWLVEIVPDMIYNVFGGTLNPTLLLQMKFCGLRTRNIRLNFGTDLEWIQDQIFPLFCH